MRTRIHVKPLIAVLIAAVALTFTYSAWKISDPASGGIGYGAVDATDTNAAAKVDFDFTKMNSTMRMTYTCHLAANPVEFSGKTLRISGKFMTRVDDDDGKRYFGCLMGDSGGCSCCAAGYVIEFMPKDSYVWPTGFPPVESRILVTGRLEMPEVGPQEQSVPIPRLVDADMDWKSR